MAQNQTDKRNKVGRSIIILLSITGLLVCFAFFIPQVRLITLDYVAKFFHRETIMFESWYKALLSFAMGGCCFILFFDYCILTVSGRALVKKVKLEITDCLSEIDFHSFIKPVLIMSGIYLLGIFTIIRADFSYMDDVGRAVVGFREWYNWSRYVSEFSSILIHGHTNLTDISPLPQLLAVLFLSISSVLLVYIIGNKKITTIRLLASIPLGLSPYFLECLSFKFDTPYIALSVLAGIFPFIFISRKRAFIFFSVVSLLIMCMTYQAVSGIYLLIVVMLGFQDWNNKRKSNKEILSFLGTAVFTYCFAMLLFRLFLMRSTGAYVSTAMYSVSQMIPGILSNIKNYAISINQDFGIIWKTGIILVLLFFIRQSIVQSSQKKTVSLLLSIFVVCTSFILSYGVYTLLAKTLFLPRALIGFGAFLAIFCIQAVSFNSKFTVIFTLALNWCLFIFAFSYGNALADQKRYSEFRMSILLHDLSSMHFNRPVTDLSIQLENSIDFAPTIKNISKQNPVIERLVPKRFGTGVNNLWDEYSYRACFDFYGRANISWLEDYVDYKTLDLPVVVDSYYHTIQSDGDHVLITLKR